MVRAALTGHLVFSTLHTNDALGAIPRLVDLGVEPYLLAPTLAAVLAQRLVRRLCPACRTQVPDAAKRLSGLAAQIPTEIPVSLWEPKGCPDCHDAGYSGRTGIYEFLAIDAEFQPAIVNGVDVPLLRRLSRERGIRTMFEDGVNKALRGVTSLAEVLRVTQQ
jgi:type II secretory ATPase GspE/PulE/Tfp pilus assembly ATPase PilB-like protein